MRARCVGGARVRAKKVASVCVVVSQRACSALESNEEGDGGLWVPCVVVCVCVWGEGRRREGARALLSKPRRQRPSSETRFETDGREGALRNPARLRFVCSVVFFPSISTTKSP